MIRSIGSFGTQEFADSQGIPYIETSAKNSTNVEEAFYKMASEIQSRVESSLAAQGIETDGGNDTVKVGGAVDPNAKKGCCK